MGKESAQVPFLLNGQKIIKNKMIYRAKIAIGIAVDMSIDTSVPNQLTVTTTNGTSNPTDYSSGYLTSGLVFQSNGDFIIPNDGKKYWWIPFDSTDIPRELPWDDTPIETKCAPCSGTGNNGGSCDKHVTAGRTDCYGTCSGHCAVDIKVGVDTIINSFVVGSGDTLYYNGVLYT